MIQAIVIRVHACNAGYLNKSALDYDTSYIDTSKMPKIKLCMTPLSLHIVLVIYTPLFKTVILSLNRMATRSFYPL
jgi:hypothetical protein